MQYTEKIEILYTHYKNADALPAELQQLIAQAKAAAEMAHAPYSNFLVGCALRTVSGRVITGNNQENAAFPSGLCAERTALFYYGSMYPHDPISHLVIVAKQLHQNHWSGACPCGACRQVMLEYELKQEKPFAIIFQQEHDNYIEVKSVKHLLPFQFNGSALKPSNI